MQKFILTLSATRRKLRNAADIRRATFLNAVVLTIALFVVVLPLQLFAQAPSISYSGSHSYLINSAITAATPSNGGGAVDAPAYSSTPVNIFSGTSYSVSAVFDAAGNIYTFDFSVSNNRKLVKLSPAGTNPTTLISFLGGPQDIDIDPSGNIFVLDGATIYKVTPGGTVSTFQTLASASGIGINAVGDVYVARYSNVGSIHKFPADGSSGTDIGSGLSYMTDVAIDAAGNIYVCNDGDASIKKVSADGSSVVTIASGFTSFSTADLSQITLDPSGNIFFSERNGGKVSEILAGSNTPVAIGSGYFAPNGLTLDAAGNLFVMDSGTLKEIKPIGGYYISPALPAGLSFNQTTGAISGTPTALSDEKDYSVTAYNASGKSSTVISIGVFASLATDAFLTNLTINYASFSPPFDKSTFIYTMNVPFSVTAVALTPTVEEAHATVIIYAHNVISGTPSLDVPLAPGTNTIFVVVTAQNGTTKNIYSVAVTRAAGSAIADLSGLTTTANSFGPAFDANSTAGYTASVPFSTTTTTVTPTVADANATVQVKINSGGYLPVSSGTTSANLPLNVGDNTISVKVTAEDGTTNKIYTLTVSRAAASSTALLSTLSISPPTKLTRITGVNYADYIAKVFGNVHSVKVIPVLVDNTAAITINGITAVPGVESAPVTLHNDTTAIAVTVTAADGITKNTYRMVITRLPSTNAVLKSIALSPATPLTRVTGTNYADYTAKVFSPASSVSVVPVTADNTSKITVNGIAATSGVASAPVTLNADTTAIAVTVTAGDGVSKLTYRIVVTRQANANLSSLTLSPAVSMIKVAGPDYADYKASIYHSATSVRVIPVTADAPATVTVNGVAATSGVQSAPVALHGDTTSIAVTVTAGDGVTKNTYKVLVTRLPPGNAQLKSIALSPATPLTNVTGPDYADYTAHVFSQVTTMQVIPTTVENIATITVNGVTATSGVPSAPVTLNADTTTIATTVIAGDGVSKLTYKILVTRTYNAYLSNIALSPTTTLSKEQGANYADYTATVLNSTKSVKVIPATADNAATVTVNGVAATSGVESAQITLNNDTTAIAVTVTGGDGIAKNTYRIVVHRLPLTNALLKSLAFNPTTKLNSVDGPDFADYTASVPGTVHSVKVIPVTADSSFTVTVNGVATASGAQSAPITLNADTTTIATTVTAGDGVSKLTYKVVVTRAPSNNAVLKSIALSPNTKLSKTIGPDYTDYIATVPNSTNSLQVMPVTADNGATLTVNGVVTASGATSAAITLNADTTTIATTVTAEDGMTKKSYVTLVTRLAPGPHVMAYDAPKETPVISTGIVVHQNVSPNGDGRSDVLTIDGIAAHPDNKLQIMSRSGALVYEAKGYDNTSKVFDGHAIDGKLQQAGTYLYSLEYKDGNELKRKTGYIVLRY